MQMWFMINLQRIIFQKKIESVHYNAAVAITGAIKGSSRENLYQELGLEYHYQKKMGEKIVLIL